MINETSNNSVYYAEYGKNARAQAMTVPTILLNQRVDRAATTTTIKRVPSMTQWMLMSKWTTSHCKAIRVVTRASVN